MEAPKKIYLYPSDRAGEDYEDEWGTMPWGEDYVEYTRTDAFIEKSLKWYCLDCECNDNCNADHKCFYRQEYKRYLEGNDNAVPPKFDNAIFPDEDAAKNYRYRHYIQKMQDAFIEKACEGIEHLLSGYIIRNFHFGDSYEMDTLIEDFKNYMKEE